jgi:hypothetical protein
VPVLRKPTLQGSAPLGHRRTYPGRGDVFYGHLHDTPAATASAWSQGLCNGESLSQMKKSPKRWSLMKRAVRAVGGLIPPKRPKGAVAR